MRKLLLIPLPLFVLFLIPNTIFGQAPNLGATSSFALFTAVGAFSNTGATVVNGDIGTNVGAFTGFPPGVVNGQIHVADVISAQAAIDVDIAYGSLSGVTCGLVIGTSLGGGQILTPNVYCLGAASTLSGDLILDGGCNPNALFIIKVNGALSTTAFSHVILINSASSCNVYWQINGAVELGEGSVFRGTILANGAITLLEGASLLGRGLSRQGAIELHNNAVDIDMQATASTISASGVTTFCTGGSVTLSGNCGGVWSTGATTASIIVTTSGNYSVSNSNNCGSATSNQIIVTVNPLPVCTITGSNSICQGQSTQLCTPAGAASYLWSTGAITNCISVNTAGTYSVTVTNASGCSSICSTTVTLSPSPICTITGNTTICQGQSTQLCTPAGAASYLWSTGAITNCISVNTAGTYAVTVTNASGCSSICSIIVSLSPSPICTITGNNVICQGQSTQLCTPAGAASYLWSTGAITNCISVNTAGTYAVTVTNASGCSSICSIIVSLSPLPICTITGNNVICQGQSTQLCTPAGAASYLWSTGAITNCISVNTAGTYAVTVTNASGCSSICSIIVMVSPSPICTITGNNVICQGQSTQLCTPAGAASYLWSTGAITNCISVNAAGTYAVTVTNVSGCSSICSIIVTLSPSPICTITGNTTICQGQSTQLCTPAGAASYLWSTGAITNCISVNAAGTYAVTVTNVSGCSSICSIIVSLSPSPICTITGNTTICQGQSTQLCTPAGAASYLWSTGAITNCISLNTAGTYAVTVTNASGCSSICSIIVTLSPSPICTITGNTTICQGQSTQLCTPAGAASYLWSTGAITNCISVNTAGTYAVTVTNVSGCSSICSIIVSLSPSPICTITGNNVICQGQSTQLCTPAGAASYLWSTGAITNCISVNTAGTYAVTVTNASGCSSICSIIVSLSPSPICTITGNTTICQGQSTQLCTPAGAASYLWSTGAITNCISVNAAGTYAVTVTNASGCSSICSIIVTLSPSPICTITGNNVICQGQSTQLCTPAGAASYLWSTGAITNCISVNTAGTYAVTVTNASGCSSICSIIVTLSPSPICTITGNNVICQGQSTQLCTPAGASSYLWSTGAITNCISVNTAGTYAVTVTNVSGCSSICSIIVTVSPLPICTITGNNFICGTGQTTQLCTPDGASSYLWSTGATNNCIIVGAGTFTVTVTNANGCSSICSESVTINPQPSCTISGNEFICGVGQSTQLCVPAGAVSYLWSTGAITNCIIVNTAGTYAVTATTANGCSSICSKTVSISPSPICTITGNTSICEGQSTQLCTPAGAASYSWSTGATTNCVTVGAGTYSVTVTNANGCSSICSKTVSASPSPICLITGNTFICGTGQTTQLCTPDGASSYLWSTGATNNCIIVGAGTFTVTVTNTNGCSSICSESVTINPQPSCTISGNEFICAEGQTTQLCVPAGAESYLWSTGAITNCISVSTAGTYAVTVTYASGCTSICSKTVTVSPTPACTITCENVICEGDSTQLCVLAGATSYLWSTGATTNCITVHTAGTYSVTITYPDGCTSICSKTITVSPFPNCEITSDCDLPCDGQPTLLCAPAGCAAYLWCTGATTSCIIVSTSGTYCVTVTNSNGCSSVCCKTVVIHQAPNCEITGDCTIACGGQPIQLCAPAGCANYLWSNGATTSCILVSVPGNYCVTVTNSSGCSSVCSKIVTLGQVINCEITGDCTIPCGGQPILLCAPAGCANYLWSNGATTSCILVSVPGNYCVTVTNSSGCSSVCSKIVTFGQVMNCEITGDCIIPCGGQPTLLCAPAGCANYLWSNGATTSCILVSVPGNYCVTVTNSSGCSSVCSKIVTLDQVINCAITGNNAIPCSGQPILLCAPAGCAAYLWSNGATTSCIMVSVPGNYAVTVTNLSGCSSVCSKIVTVGLASVCQITGNFAIPCGGQPTLLCAPSGFASYLWSTGATTSCIIASTAGNYCVTVTNTGGCTSTSCVTVTQADIPPFVITGDTINCGNAPTLLCAPSGFTSYLWSNGATTSCIIADMQSSYSVTVTNANGCSNTSSITIGFGAVCNITGNLDPNQGQTTELCAPADLASYLWSTGDTTRCTTVNASGTYSVTVVNANGCTSSCSANVAYHIIVVANSDSLLYNTGNLQVQAYPNPFQKTSTIEFMNTESSSHVLIEVYKLTGNKVSTLFERDIEQGKRYTTELDGENLSEGVYMCRIINGNQIINKKLVLIR